VIPEVLNPTTTDVGPCRPITDPENPVRRYLGSLSPGSRQVVRSRLKRILAEAEVTGDIDLFPWHILTLSTVAEVLDRLKESALSPSSVAGHLSAVKGIAKWCWRLGQMSGDVHARIADLSAPPGSSPPVGRALSPEEIRDLLQACAVPGPAACRDAVGISIMYGCGLRRQELCDLDLEDFREGSPSSLVIRHGKGGKSSIVSVPDAASRTVQTWLRLYRGDEDGPLICQATRGAHGRLKRTPAGALRRLSATSLARSLERRGVAAGLAHFSPHDLRRSYITALLDVGVALEIVQRCARHSSPTTTTLYDKRPFQEQERACQKLPLCDYPLNFVATA